MKLREIYELFVEKGIENDPRGKNRIEKLLAGEQKKYDKLEKDEKQYYDVERLVNPFADTRILTGDENTEVKRVLVGVDMEVGEVLLADRLTEKGQKIAVNDTSFKIEKPGVFGLLGTNGAGKTTIIVPNIGIKLVTNAMF